MKKIFTLIFVLSSLITFGQTDSTLPKEKKLIADETYLSEDKSSFKIITSNDTVSGMLLANFDGVIKTYTVSKKKDRFGEYNEFRVTFPNEAKPRVLSAIISRGTDSKKTAVRPTRKQ